MEIYIEDTEQYLLLIALIEDYNLSQPKVVTYIGKPSHIVPTQERLELPYTTYNKEENTLLADDMIIQLCIDSEIQYTEV